MLCLDLDGRKMTSHFEQAKAAIINGSQIVIEATQSIQPNDERGQLEQYITYSTLLEIHLSDPDRYTIDEQIELLQLLTAVLTPPVLPSTSEETPSNNLLIHIGWDLINVLSPYLISGSLMFLKSPRSLASDIMQAIGAICNPREVYLMILERWSTIDWNESTEMHLRRGFVEIVELGKVLTVAIPRISSQNPSKFLTEPVRHIEHALDYIEALEQLDMEEGEREQLESSVIEFVFYFAEKFNNVFLKEYSQPLAFHFSSQPNPELAMVHYVLTHLILTVLPQTRMPELAKEYYEALHPQYVVRLGRQRNDDITITELGDRTWNSSCRRVLETAIMLGISLERLLGFQDFLYKDYLMLSVTDESAIDLGKWPLPSKGVIILLALSIFSSSVLSPVESDVTQKFLPLILDPIWVARKVVVMAEPLLSMDERIRITDSDYALLCLHYLADRILEDTFGVEDIDTPLTPDQSKDHTKATIMSLVQNLTAFAASCSQPSTRFLTHQLLGRLIFTLREDARAAALIDVLERCPFANGRGMMVEFLKECVDSGMKKDQSLFASDFMITKFFRVIFKYSKLSRSKSPPEHVLDSGFWENYAYYMQVLNFYVFLLMRDSHNQTGVWDRSNLEQVKNDFLVPLGADMALLKAQYEQELKNRGGGDPSDQSLLVTHSHDHQSSSMNSETRVPMMVKMDIPIQLYEGVETERDTKLTAEEERTGLLRKLLELDIMRDGMERIIQIVEGKARKG